MKFWWKEMKFPDSSQNFKKNPSNIGGLFSSVWGGLLGLSHFKFKHLKNPKHEAQVEKPKWCPKNRIQRPQRIRFENLQPLPKGYERLEGHDAGFTCCYMEWKWILQIEDWLHFHWTLFEHLISEFNDLAKLLTNPKFMAISKPFLQDLLQLKPPLDVAMPGPAIPGNPSSLTSLWFPLLISSFPWFLGIGLFGIELRSQTNKQVRN